MKQKLLLLILLLFLICDNSHAQVLLEDAEGETTIKIGQSPFAWARFNTSDESATIGYNRQRTDGADWHLIGNTYDANLLYGGDVKVKLTDGVGNLMEENKFKPGIALNGNFGILANREINEKINVRSFYIRGGVEYSDLTYLDTNLITSNELSKWTGNIAFHINQQWVRGTKENPSYWFLGFSIGVKGKTNYEDLDKGSFSKIITHDSLNSVSRVKEGRIGEYELNTVIPINFDIAYLPRIKDQNIVGFNTYIRSNFGKPDNKVNTGFGLFINKENKINSVIGGLAWQFNDVTNEEKQKNLIKNSTVFVYLGYSI